MYGASWAGMKGNFDFEFSESARTGALAYSEMAFEVRRVVGCLIFWVFASCLQLSEEAI